MTSPIPTTAGQAGGHVLWAVIAWLLAACVAACAVASAAHAGLRLAIGALSLSEKPIVAASIVEGAVALALVIPLAGMLSRRAWASRAAIGAFGFGVAGFLVGVTVVARNASMQTPFNVGVHALVLPLLAIGLGLSLSGAGRRALAPPVRASAQGQRVPH